MIKSINAGFSAPLSPDDLTQMHAMRLQGVRTEIPVRATRDEMAAILSALVGSGLSINLLFHGEAMPALELCMQVLDAYLLATNDLGLPLAAIEPANEPNIHDCDPLDMSVKLTAVHDALGTAGFTGTIYGGSVANLNREGLSYLQDMQWKHLPREIEVAVHRYAPRNTPGASHFESLQHEIVAAMEATGRKTPPALTEMGYHTALQTADWQWKPPFYQPAFRLTNEQAAEALFNDLNAYASWGVPRCDVFQWNCGIPDDDEDYEALYGVRAPDGTWLPQGVMLAQIGTL